MSKEDVKIIKLYEDLTQNIEEFLENENAEILLEDDALLVNRILQNMNAAAEHMGKMIDSLVNMASGMKVILTKSTTEKIKTISNFLNVVAARTKSKAIKDAADKVLNWANARELKEVSKKVKSMGWDQKIVDPPKITSIIDRLHAIAKRGLAILNKNPKSILAGAIIAAGITTAGIMVYKKYLSAGTRSCKGKEGADRQKCLVQFRINGYKAEISIIRSSEGKCGQSNDPMTCRKRLEDRIKNLQSRIKSLGEK